MKRLKWYFAAVLTTALLAVAGCGGGSGGSSGQDSSVTTGKSLAGSWLITYSFGSSSCSSTPAGSQSSFTHSITQQSSNVYALIPPQGISFGRQGDTSPFILTQQNNTLSGTFNVSPNPADACPTCSWSQTISAAVDSSGDKFTGTYTKNGTGGECSSSASFSGVRQ